MVDVDGSCFSAKETVSKYQGNLYKMVAFGLDPDRHTKLVLKLMADLSCIDFSGMYRHSLSLNYSLFAEIYWSLKQIYQAFSPFDSLPSSHSHMPFRVICFWNKELWMLCVFMEQQRWLWRIACLSHGFFPPWKELHRTSGLLVLVSCIIYFVLTFLSLLWFEYAII